jgi:aldehyde dehydrogenase (NAD+)
MSKVDVLEYLQKDYNLFIKGVFQSSKSGETFSTYNPTNGELIAKISSASKEDVDLAVAAAKEAFDGWSKTSVQERGNILLNIADRLEERIELFAAVESIDTGRAIVETREDVVAVVDQFRYFAGCIRAQEGSAVEHNSKAFSILLREPFGVVAQIIPWNFPFLMAGWKLAPALAAGNTIVIKPASNTPLSILEFAKLVQSILPAGVLNILTGSGRECGEYLINHADIDKIAFTGSTEVGLRMAKAAAEKIIPATLELGGKSANIIFPDAPMEKAIEGAVLGILYSQGQVCSAGSRLFVHEDIYNNVVAELKKAFSKVRIGDPLDENTRMGPMIDEKQLNAVLDYVKIGIGEGAVLEYGGNRLTGGELERGYFMEPTIFTDVNNSMRIAREEIFGPVLVVIPFKDEQEVIAMANDSEYGLAGAVWTKDINRALRVAKAVRTGTMWVNEYNLVPSHSPFGGYKKSGYGREVHKTVLDHYSQIKNIYISLSEEPCGWYK